MGNAAITDNRTDLLLVVDVDKTCIYNNGVDLALDTLGIDRNIFSSAVQVLVRCGLDPITAYLREFQDVLDHRGRSVAESDLYIAGTQADLVQGLPEAVLDARELASALNVSLNVVALTAGFEAVVRGSPLADLLDDCIGVTWHCDADGHLVYPNRVVTAADKAEILAQAANGPLAGVVPSVPISRIAFIGDGFSDLPSFELVGANGGRTLLVHGDDFAGANDAADLALTYPALQTAVLDYRRGSYAYGWIMEWLTAMATTIEKSKTVLEVRN